MDEDDCFPDLDNCELHSELGESGKLTTQCSILKLDDNTQDSAGRVSMTMVTDKKMSPTIDGSDHRQQFPPHAKSM